MQKSEIIEKLKEIAETHKVPKIKGDSPCGVRANMIQEALSEIEKMLPNGFENACEYAICRNIAEEIVTGEYRLEGDYVFEIYADEILDYNER